MSSHHYLAPTIRKFGEMSGHNFRATACKKCGVAFEPDDDVLTFGHVAHRKYYHKACFREY